MSDKSDDLGKKDKVVKGNSLFEQWLQYTSAMASGAVSAAQFPNILTQMFGERWLKEAMFKTMDPERLAAMAEAGKLIKDAREVAGLSAAEMAAAMGMKDPARLEAVEKGEEVLPFEMIFRSASLVARYDPVPFILKFMRTYNPGWSDLMDKWGVTALPKQYERERRFLNVYRKYDELRKLDDAEYERFVDYIDSAAELVLGVMMNEKEANVSDTE
jgi:transcriptional regulator with XRE-family HTH domain